MSLAHPLSGVGESDAPMPMPACASTSHWWPRAGQWTRVERLALAMCATLLALMIFFLPREVSAGRLTLKSNQDLIRHHRQQVEAGTATGPVDKALYGANLWPHRVILPAWITNAEIASRYEPGVQVKIEGRMPSLAVGWLAFLVLSEMMRHRTEGRVRRAAAEEGTRDA